MRILLKFNILYYIINPSKDTELMRAIKCIFLKNLRPISKRPSALFENHHQNIFFYHLEEILRLREHEQLTARTITIEYWYSNSHRGVHRRPANCHYHGKILRKSKNSDVALRNWCAAVNPQAPFMWHKLCRFKHN